MKGNMMTDREETFRHYLTSITEAYLENAILEMHRMVSDAIADYAKDNITYKQLYVIKAIVATFTIASMQEA